MLKSSLKHLRDDVDTRATLVSLAEFYFAHGRRVQMVASSFAEMLDDVKKSECLIPFSVLEPVFKDKIADDPLLRPIFADASLLQFVFFCYCHCYICFNRNANNHDDDSQLSLSGSSTLVCENGGQPEEKAQCGMSAPDDDDNDNTKCSSVFENYDADDNAAVIGGVSFRPIPVSDLPEPKRPRLDESLRGASET